MLLPYLQVYVTLLMIPECVRVEEWFVAEGGHQPHSQVYPAHGSIRHWWALPATLNLTSVHSFDAPNWIWRGCMSAGISPSKTEGAVEEVDSSACSAGTEASGSLDAWGGRWEMVEEGAWQDFLWGGEDVGREECDTAPLRSPYKSSASEPVTTTSIFSNPSVSTCWASLSSLFASSCSELACFSRFSPYKRKKKKGYKGIALEKVTWSYKKEGRINLPLSTAPMPPLWVGLGNPPPGPNSIKYQYLLFLCWQFWSLLLSRIICQEGEE